MKKIIFSLAVIGVISFTSCKKTTETVADTTEAAADTVAETADDVADATVETAENAIDAGKEILTNVPQVDNAEVQAVIDEYKGYISEFLEAGNKGDADALGELQAKSPEMTDKLMEAVAKLPEDQKAKVLEWQSKIAGNVGG